MYSIMRARANFLKRFCKENPISIAVLICMIVIAFLVVALIHENDRITNYLLKARPASQERSFIQCEETQKIKSILRDIDETGYEQDIILLKKHELLASPEEIRVGKKLYKFELKKLAPTNCEKIAHIGPNPEGLH
jgi:hypothetical protein